jgi:hypothetical protein
VGELRGELPGGTELEVERLTTSAFPILSYNVTGGLPEADLRDYAFYVVRPAIARVPGVGRVEVLSSDTREIQVVTQPPRLLASGLTVHDVADALKASNQVTPVAPVSVRRAPVPRAGIRSLELGPPRSRRRRCRSRAEPWFGWPIWATSSRGHPTASLSSPATGGQPRW